MPIVQGGKTYYTEEELDKLREKKSRDIPSFEAYIEDMVSDFLYYDRKEDPDLDQEMIDEMFEDGHWKIDDVVECFREQLEKSYPKV